MIHTCHTAAIQTYPEILQQKTSDDVYHILHAKDRTSDVKLNKRIKKDSIYFPTICNSSTWKDNKHSLNINVFRINLLLKNMDLKKIINKIQSLHPEFSYEEIEELFDEILGE